MKIKKELKLIFTMIIIQIILLTFIGFKSATLPTNQNYHQSQQYDSLQLRAEIFFNDHTMYWGYKIYVNNMMYILQTTLPGDSSKGGFHSPETAQASADLVVKKIKNNIIPPSISTQEMDSLGKLYQ